MPFGLSAFQIGLLFSQIIFCATINLHYGSLQSLGRADNDIISDKGKVRLTNVPMEDVPASLTIRAEFAL